MKSTEKLLSIRHLKQYFPVKKSFFGGGRRYVRANEDISLDILRGETLGLVGESGCGKSTLGRTVLQLYRPTAGRVLYYGRSLEEFAPDYVVKTLKNAAREVALWRKKEEGAERLAQRCERLGERASFDLLQRLSLARAQADTARERLSSLLGGFMTLEDPGEGATLLLERHLLRTRLCRLAKGEEEKRQQLSASLQVVEERLRALRLQYGNNEAFIRCEAELDDEGVDLAALTHREMRRLRGDLQIIFQDPYSSLNPRMSVGRIIAEGPVTHGMAKRGSKTLWSHVLNLMGRCGLQAHMIHRYPHEFSGGQRQRIGIARALSVDPKFVVCDECVSALDVSIQSQIINLLQELKEQNHLTYLFITHDLAVVRYMADRIGVMYLGDIVELGQAEQVFSDARHPYTVALLSCVPDPDASKQNSPRILLGGSIPSPIHPPRGCKFHTRCYMACDVCRTKEPPVVEVSPGHLVACHFPEKKICSPND